MMLATRAREAAGALRAGGHRARFVATTLVALCLFAATAGTAHRFGLAVLRARHAPATRPVPHPLAQAEGLDEDMLALVTARSVLTEQRRLDGDEPRSPHCSKARIPVWTPLRLRISPVEPWCSNTLTGDAALWLAQGWAFLAGYHAVSAYDSFVACARLAPACYMCHLGIAHAFGATINDANTPSMRKHGRVAALKAQAAANAAAEPRARLARLLAAAALARFSEAPDRDVAYARAMDASVVAAATDSADTLALAAEAHMLLVPWRFYEHSRESRFPYQYPVSAKAPTRRAVEYIDQALAIEPHHAHALHLHIHLLEPSDAVARAARSADTLLRLATGPLGGAVDHLTHMPSHVYFNIQRFEDAARANDIALADAAAGAQTHCAYAYKLSHDAHVAAIAYARLGLWSEARGHAESATGGRPYRRGCLVAALAARLGRWDEANLAARAGSSQSNATGFDAAMCNLVLALVAAVRRDADAAGVARHASDVACARVARGSDDDRVEPLCNAVRHASAAALAFAIGDAQSGARRWSEADDASRNARYIEPPRWVLPTDDLKWPQRVGLM